MTAHPRGLLTVTTAALLVAALVSPPRDPALRPVASPPGSRPVVAAESAASGGLQAGAPADSGLAQRLEHRLKTEVAGSNPVSGVKAGAPLPHGGRRTDRGSVSGPICDNSGVGISDETHTMAGDARGADPTSGVAVSGDHEWSARFQGAPNPGSLRYPVPSSGPLSSTRCVSVGATGSSGVPRSFERRANDGLTRMGTSPSGLALGPTPSTVSLWKNNSADPSVAPSPSITRTATAPTTDPKISNSGSAPSAAGSVPSISVARIAAGPTTPTSRAVSGIASWFCVPGRSACTAGYSATCTCAAAGPALRVGDWRGRVVTVTAGRVSVAVRLVDWCQCGGGRVIDLFGYVFAQLAPNGLSQGILEVEVSWP